MTDHCYLCGTEINDENISKEHIIPNAIGGKLVSIKLLCNNCNIKTGDVIDFALSKTLEPLCNLINVKRDRGTPTSLKITLQSGKKIILRPGFKPEAVPNVEKLNNKINITARNENEALEKLHQLQVKYPSIDVDNAMEKLQHQKKYIDEKIPFKLELNDECLRSLGKIIASFYIYRGNDKEKISKLIDFIKDDQKVKTLWQYTEDSPFAFNKYGVYNIVSIIGDSNTKKLVGFVEIFSTIKFFIIINNNYAGETFSQNYYYNVETGASDKDIIIKTVKKEKFFTNISRDTYDICLSNYEKSFNELMNYCHKKSNDEARFSIISQSFDECQRRFPPEKYPYFTDEMIEFLSKDVSEKFVAYLYETKQLGQ